MGTMTARRRKVKHPCQRRPGPKNGRWHEDGRFIDSRGYVVIRVAVDHPHGWDKRKVDFRYCYEHIDVMYRHIGRRLRRDEEVHHKNEIKTDNRIENLEIRLRGPHQEYHAYRRTRIAGKFAPEPPKDEDCYDWDEAKKSA